jgi:hypothetical protein
VIGRHRQHDHVRRAGARVGVGDRPPHVRGDPLARERGADPRHEHVVAAGHRDREPLHRIGRVPRDREHAAAGPARGDL